ncbi:hypothetical protein Tco_1216012 [Tanacetum coccineum]
MVIVNWKLRPKGDRVNPYVKYKNDPNMFTLKVNHGGVFTYVYGLKRTRAPRRVYKGGNADWFDDVDADGFSVLEVSGMVNELGYENPEMKFYYKKPTAELDTSLEPLRKDIDVLDMLSYTDDLNEGVNHTEGDDNNEGVDQTKVSDNNEGVDHTEVSDNNEGVDHTKVSDNNEGVDQTKVSDNNEGVDHTEVSDNNEGVDHTKVSDNNEGDGQTESSDDNEKSDDSDFECDLEDRIDDVHVEMQMFKDNIDPNVEWVSCNEPEPQAENIEEAVYEEVDLEDFDSEIDSDDEEAERKKDLRMLRKSLKPVDGKTNTENFYVSQTFPTKGMIKDMVTRVGPNEDGLGVGPSGGDGLSGSKSKASGLDSIKKKTKKGGDIKKKSVGETLKCP